MPGVEWVAAADSRAWSEISVKSPAIRLSKRMLRPRMRWMALEPVVDGCTVTVAPSCDPLGVVGIEFARHKRSLGQGGIGETKVT